MNSNAHYVYGLIEEKRIASANFEKAIKLSGFLPTIAEWRRFIDRLLLFLGALFISVGVIFFFAYNWNNLGQFAQFGIAETLAIFAVGYSYRTGLEDIRGQAGLLAGSLLIGALFALIGQTYQTGADTYELFVYWALAILPWVTVARSTLLLVLWIALLNTAVVLYCFTYNNLPTLETYFGKFHAAWIPFILNSTIAVVWELAGNFGIKWLQVRWAIRLLLSSTFTLITALCMHALLVKNHDGSILTWFLYTAGVFLFYRYKLIDIYLLSCVALSSIIVFTTFMGRYLIPSRADAGAFLFIGLVVIGLSAAAGKWLKDVAHKSRSYP